MLFLIKNGRKFNNEIKEFFNDRNEEMIRHTIPDSSKAGIKIPDFSISNFLKKTRVHS
jgi:hypothetical protein